MTLTKPPPTPLCDCRLNSFTAWRELRGAVGVDQAALADQLFCSPRLIQRMESEVVPHRCPNPAVVGHLRYLLREPAIRQLLDAGGVPNPYPEDEEVEPR